MQDTPTTPFKAGYVAVMGRPNVGKSTLVNALLGQKVAAVSPRPQTTRKRQMGILTNAQVQVVFVDTPGLHQPRHKLGEAMNAEAAATLENSDLILFVVDASQPPDAEDRLLVEHLRKLKHPPSVLLALNKIDLAAPAGLDDTAAAYGAILPAAVPLRISAARGDGLPELLDAIVERLPPGDPFFPEDQVTDLYEREIAADLIRAAALNILRDEVPHGIAVRIDQFQERRADLVYIEATLFVERESHKGIVIGQGGSMLKRIGASARQEIETMGGHKIFLDLKVKVRKNWRDDEKVLKNFGY